MKKKIILFTIILLIIPLAIKAEGTSNIVNVLSNTNKIITETTSANINDNTNIFCGQDTYIPFQLVNLVRSIINLIKLGVPILFIIMGMLDLGKVVVASKDEEMKKHRKNFVSRLIIAVAVFFVVSIVQVAIGLVDSTDETLACMKCIVKDSECKYVDIEYETPEVTPSPTSTPTARPTPASTPEPTEVPEETNEIDDNTSNMETDNLE